MNFVFVLTPLMLTRTNVKAGVNKFISLFEGGFGS